MNKKKIKLVILSLLDFMEEINAISVEKNKYKNKDRIEICNSVKLTKDQTNDIEEFYKKNYGKKIPLDWHKSYMAFTGNFDVKYIPEFLFIPKFERYMNYNKSLADVLEDKNLLYIFANKLNVRMPKKIISCQDGIYSDSDNNILSFDQAVGFLKNIGECFSKPSIGSDSGRGCEVHNYQNGIDTKTGEDCSKSLYNMGDNFVIQERLICHESVRKIYPNSVNTFRIMTYRWHNEIVTAPVIMRIGQGGAYLDNAHAGGMFIALSNDGELHKKAFTEFNKSYEIHPDSNLKFEGYKIELFPNVLETAKKMHSLLPSIGVINWDMTIDESGNPTIIEANVNCGSIWLFQMAHGCGVFEERTSEILKWIRKMEKGGYAYRQVHHYGD